MMGRGTGTAGLEIATILVAYEPKIVSVRGQNIFESANNRYGATGFNFFTKRSQISLLKSMCLL